MISNDDLEDDWGWSPDDADGEYWEDSFGGPDDSDIERYQAQSLEWYLRNFDEENDDSFAYEDCIHPSFFDVDPHDLDIELSNFDDNRRKQIIIGWLYNSKSAVKYTDRPGFFIPSGITALLKNNVNMEITKWLIEEGFCDGMLIGGYQVYFQLDENGSIEIIQFILREINVPFEHKE